MTAMELASKLARLEGVEHQFDTLVGQILAGQRQQAMSRIMGKPGAMPSNVERDMEVLDQALEKMEHNLRCQYEEFLSAHVRFRAEKLSTEELEQYVDALNDEQVQSYFTKMRSLQEDSVAVFQQVTEKIIRAATGGISKDAASPSPQSPPVTRL